MLKHKKSGYKGGGPIRKISRPDPVTPAPIQPATAVKGRESTGSEVVGAAAVSDVIVGGGEIQGGGAIGEGGSRSNCGILDLDRSGSVNVVQTAPVAGSVHFSAGSTSINPVQPVFGSVSSISSPAQLVQAPGVDGSYPPSLFRPGSLMGSSGLGHSGLVRACLSSPTVEPPKATVTAKPGSAVTNSPLAGVASGASWSALFGPSVSTGSPLQYFPPVLVDGELVAIPSDEIVSEGEKLWENSLVGQFLDSRPPFAVVSHLISRVWSSVEAPLLTFLDNGLVIFQFQHGSSCDTILSKGPWHIGGKPLILRRWTPGIVPQTFTFDSVPVWVKLSDIPLELWTPQGLSVIASVLGKPICLDKPTEDRSRLSFARICVEMSVGSAFPTSIKVRVRDAVFSVSVEYAWRPRRCSACCVFGHSDSHCPKAPRKVWVPKSQPAVPPKSQPVVPPKLQLVVPPPASHLSAVGTKVVPASHILSEVGTKVVPASANRFAVLSTDMEGGPLSVPIVDQLAGTSNPGTEDYSPLFGGLELDFVSGDQYTKVVSKSSKLQRSAVLSGIRSGSSSPSTQYV